MVHADPPLDFGNPPVPYREAWQRARTIIKELAGHAKTRGVVIGLENVFYNKFLITQVEYRKFLDEVAEECVKLYFDIGNTMLCGFPEDWIEDLAPYICQIHVKDFDKNVNTLHGWRNIFQGHVNWKNVTDALRKIRYQGYLVGEPALSPYLFQPEELVRVTSSALDRLREMVNAPA
jgi:hexulose-6-phosphate isomerase